MTQSGLMATGEIAIAMEEDKHVVGGLLAYNIKCVRQGKKIFDISLPICRFEIKRKDLQ
jgi:hypothetical protein